MSNLGTNQPVGRRLDQVQTRRRRMKNARAMKVLYYYVDEVFQAVNGDNDISMEFEANKPVQPTKKLKIIDLLIDLKISAEMIDRNVILSEDGNLYQIESQIQNASIYQDNVYGLNESASQSNISHSGGFGGNIVAGDSQISI